MLPQSSSGKHLTQVKHTKEMPPQQHANNISNIRIDSLTNKRETKLLGLVPPKKCEQFQVPPSTDVYIVKILI